MTGLLPAGFPHSDISGSTLFGRSPELLAAVHVLLRLHKPRHPPYALAYFFLSSSLFPLAKEYGKPALLAPLSLTRSYIRVKELFFRKLRTGSG